MRTPLPPAALGLLLLAALAFPAATRWSENGVEVPYGDTPGDYSTDRLRDAALAFVEDSVARGRPFFLYFATNAPHQPATPAPRHVGLFQGLAPWRPASHDEPDVSDKPAWLQALPFPPASDALRVAQLEALQAVDEAVAAILQALRLHGIADDTIVVYTSDNGLFWGEHRLTGKNLPYEEAIRVPLVVRYPRLVPLRRREDRPVLGIDLAPTFAELAGATPAPAAEGRSLVGLLDGSAREWRSLFLVEGWPAGREFATVRDARFKYTEWITGEVELYDLWSDPLELENLAGDPALAPRARRWRRSSASSVPSRTGSGAGESLASGACKGDLHSPR